MAQPQHAPSSLLDELKRRKVVRVAIVYAAVAWAIVQVADVALATFGAPPWLMQAVIVLLVLGFPLTVVLAWAFEVTPAGVQRTPAHGHAPWLSTRAAAAIVLFIAVGVGGWWAGRATAAPDLAAGPSIAVLPFDDLSGGESNRPFTDGLHDDLLTQLSKVAALRVTSRTSVQEYRDSDDPIPVIARALGVSAILEGGVQRSDQRIRINVQLIDGATDEHLWAERYDRDLHVADIFDIQSQIATAITEALRARLTSEEREAIAEQPTDDIAAYEAYLAGLAATYWATTDTAAVLFETAARLDPEFAEAWAGAARAWSWQYRQLVEGITPRERLREHEARAERAVERARTLAPRSRETRLSEGYFQYYVRWDFDAAARTFESLLEESPRDAGVRRAAALVYRRQGRWDAALEAFQDAAAANPGDGDYALDLGWTLKALRRYDEAEQVARLGLAQNPEYFRLHGLMADVLQAQGAPWSRVEPFVRRSGDMRSRTAQRLLGGTARLQEAYTTMAEEPPDAWLLPSDRAWILALVAQTAGLPEASVHAAAYLEEAAGLDSVAPDPAAPFGERRAAAVGFALRGMALAILDRPAEARADLHRSVELWRFGEDHADGAGTAKFRATVWAILGDADAFFGELEPYARIPGDLHARELADHPILRRFADDPRHSALVRALRMPVAGDG
jgi:TolB-like protein